MKSQINWVTERSSLEITIEHRDGVSWIDAPLPRYIHHCKPQTRAWADFGFRYVERCACGATRFYTHGFWLNKNETRKARR